MATIFLNKDPDYKRDSSSPFVSRNHCFHNLSKMADWSKTQYITYCKAANIGHVEEKYISTGKSIYDLYSVCYLCVIVKVSKLTRMP